MTSIISVIVDQREPTWVHGANFNAPSQTALLPAGDVMVATGDNEILLIERKTPDDLLSSIADGRLMQQALAMREQTTWSYVVITGALIPDLDGNVNGSLWKYSAVQGALISVQEVGVHVVYCNGKRDFSACVQRLAARDRGPMHVEPRRLANVYGEGQALLASLPGIGPDRAVNLIKGLPSVAWALVYLTGDWGGEHKVPGIGQGTKARVRRALGLQEGFRLEIATENGEHDGTEEG